MLRYAEKKKVTLRHTGRNTPLPKGTVNKEAPPIIFYTLSFNFKRVGAYKNQADKFFCWLKKP